MKTSKAFVFTPKQVKVMKRLLSLDLDFIGMNDADQRTADECLATLKGQTYKPSQVQTGPGTPIKMASAAEILAKLKR